MPLISGPSGVTCTGLMNETLSFTFEIAIVYQNDLEWVIE